MRRAIAATVMGGLLLGGAVATPSVAAVRGGGKPATAMKTVAYAGYEFQVPASWPVYRLDQHPETCVRYDVHAVYLGTPGKDMRCAAGLVGRTQTVSLIPGKGAATGSVAVRSAHSAAPQQPGGTQLQRLAAVHGTITQDTVNHELKVTLGTGKPGATVLGTYGTDPAAVEQVLYTLRLAPAGTASTPQSAPASPPGGLAAGASRRAQLSAQRAPLAGPTTTKPASTSWLGVPAGWPVEIVQPPPSPPSPPSPPTPPTPPTPPSPPAPPKPSPTPFHPVSGFDTCTAPSTSTMHTWRSQYAAAGIYIGGANAACAGGNLTAGWVKTVASTGWGLLPTYVGPQAPCWGAGRGVLISPATAAAQGTAAGTDAIGDARSLKLPAGSPIFYDMEAYNGGASCTNAVLKFLGAWDRQVRAAGYVTGVYSSQDSGIVDMQSGAVKKVPGFTPPDAVWIALWDNVASLNDGKLTWPLPDRSKQYSGNVNATVGGITLNIDRDFVGGPLARLPGGSRRTGSMASLPNWFA
ncbi:MAG TPA: glycoside hydrolase domain-containing protein [Trebonia sp.]